LLSGTKISPYAEEVLIKYISDFINE